MIELELAMDVQAADAERRTIEGTIVPWNVAAVLSDGQRYSFRPGSLELARARPPMILDHDRKQPIGVLAELVTEPDRGLGRFRVDRTAAGDEALTQAASGSRGALSLGATVLEWVDGAGGVVDVIRARLNEVSLLTIGAFTAAGVERVTAAAPDPPAEPDEDDPDDDPDDDELEHEPDDDEKKEALPMEPAPTAAPPVLLTARARAPRELTATEYIQVTMAANQGDRGAVEVLAALTETISTDVPGLLPPSYETTVLGPEPIDRVLYEIFKGKPMPAVGLAINKPVWTTFPNGAWAATVDDDIHTGKVVIGLNPATIERWDWGTAIPYTVVKRSSPDAIDTVYAAAVADFYQDVEIRIADLLIATAGVANAAIKLGAGISAFYTRAKVAPAVIIVAPDVWGALADAGALVPSVGFGNSTVTVGEGGLRSTYAGLTIVASPALPPGTKILASRRALDVRLTEPVQLTANAIGALNVELGVVGEALFDADYPLEVMLLAAGAPFGAELEAGPEARRK
jgi:HK97 family phage prohead protease